MIDRLQFIPPSTPRVSRAGAGIPGLEPPWEPQEEFLKGVSEPPTDPLPRLLQQLQPPSPVSMLPLLNCLGASVSMLALDRRTGSLDMDQVRIRWAECLFPNRPPPESVGPLGEIFQLEESALERLSAKRKAVRNWADDQRRFSEEWNAAEGDLQQLKEMEARWRDRPLTAEQRTHLLRSFMDHSAFGEAVEFYTRSVEREPSFAGYESTREDFIVALNKTGQPGRAIREAQSYLAERGYTGQESGENEQLTLALNARLLGGLGKAFKSVHQQAEELIDRELTASPVISLTETLTGRPLEESQQRQILALARKCLQGKAGVLDLAERVEELTGAPMSGVVPVAALTNTLKEVGKNLQKARFDPDLVAVVEETSGREIGANLLELSRVSDKLSHQYFRAGFEVDFEYYAGLETVYDRLCEGDEEGARRLSELVEFSCEREGLKDYFALATRMELALIRGHWDRAADLLPEVADAAKVGWNLKSTMSNLKKLAEHRHDQGGDTKMIDFVQQALESRLEAGVGPNSTWTDRRGRDLQEEAWALAARLPRNDADTAPNPCREDGAAPSTHLTTGRLQHKTFHFKSINSKMVGGNFSFGGVLPDITVNQTDIMAARMLLGLMDLQDTDDFETWNTSVDELLQNRFGLEDEQGRRPLEDLDSPEHKRLDQFRESLLDLTQANRSGSSRTNLMLELYLGHGDCRQVAYSKQLLYDVWKRDRQNRHLKTALEAVENGHHRKAERSLAAARRLERQQLATVSVTIQAPIALKHGEKYKLHKDEQGHPLPGPWQDIEDHTLNVLMEFDDEGRLKPDGLTAKDAFYRDLYPLADQPLDPVQAVGPGGLEAGIMGRPDSEGRPIPFKLRFTGYSGAEPERNHGESGQIHLAGTPVTPPPTYRILFGRGAADHVVDAILGQRFTS